MSFQTQYQPELESIQDIPSFHNPFTENPLCLNILRDSEEESVFAKSAEFFKNYKLACDKNSMMQEDYKEPIPYEPRDIPFTTNLLFEGSSNTEDDLVSLCSQSCYQINLNTIEKDFTVCKVVNQIDESEGKFDDSTSPDIEEIKENIPSKKEKSYMKSKPFDIYEHISERLRTFTTVRAVYRDLPQSYRDLPQSYRDLPQSYRDLPHPIATYRTLSRPTAPYRDLPHPIATHRTLSRPK